MYEQKNEQSLNQAYDTDPTDLREIVSILRACKSLANRVNTYGLDINLSEVDATSLVNFKKAWQQLEAIPEVTRASILTSSGLSYSDMISLVEVIKHGESWKISQQYGD